MIEALKLLMSSLSEVMKNTTFVRLITQMLKHNGLSLELNVRSINCWFKLYFMGELNFFLDLNVWIANAKITKNIGICTCIVNSKTSQQKIFINPSKRLRTILFQALYAKLLWSLLNVLEFFQYPALIKN